MIALSGGQENENVVTEDVPIVHQEQSIQAYIDSVTHYRMLTDGCKRAIVYVVETETGKVIAHSSLEDTGTSTFFPFSKSLLPFGCVASFCPIFFRRASFYIKICVKTVVIMLLWLFFRNFVAN